MIDLNAKVKDQVAKNFKKVLKEFSKLLPYNRLAHIFMTNVPNDSWVGKVTENLSSDELKKLMAVVHITPEFIELIEFSFKKLYHDLYYFNKMWDLFVFAK